MSVFAEIGRRLGIKDKATPEKNGKVAANQLWAAIGTMIQGKESEAFQVDRKIEKEQLPPDPRGYHDIIVDPFKVIVSGKYGRQIKIENGAHFIRLISRNPEDVKPTIEEGRTENGLDIPIQSEIPQGVQHAYNLARFVSLHWNKNHPRPNPQESLL